MVIGGIAGPYIGGALADAWSRRSEDGRPKAAAFLILLITVEKVFFYSQIGKLNLLVITLFGILDGVATMMVIPIHYSVAQDIVASKYRNLVMGVMGGICFLCGAAWGPLLTGMLSEHLGGGVDGLRRAMIYLLAFSALSALVYAGMRYQYRKDRRLAEETDKAAFTA